MHRYKDRIGDNTGIDRDGVEKYLSERKKEKIEREKKEGERAHPIYIERGKEER